MSTTSIHSNNRKQTKIVRIVSVFLAVLMMLSVIPLTSSAINDGETVRVTGRNDWISGFYYDFTSHKELGLGGKHGQHQRLKANGQVAYCVEPVVQDEERIVRHISLPIAEQVHMIIHISANPRK